MNIIDIILLIILVFFIFKGYKDGLVKTLFNLIGNVFAIIFTYIFKGVFKEIIVQITGIDKIINGFVFEKLRALGAVAIKNTTLRSDLTLLTKLPIPSSVKEQILTQVNSQVGEISANIATIFTDMALDILSAILLYVILLIIIFVLSNVLNLFSKLPIINGLNSIGGMACGFVIGLIFVVITVNGLVFLLTVGFNESLSVALKSSQIVTFLLSIF